jgi:hypothetical protein
MLVIISLQRRIAERRIKLMDSAEGAPGDDHASCDLRDDAVLDAMCFVDGISVVACPA